MPAAQQPAPAARAPADPGGLDVAIDHGKAVFEMGADVVKGVIEPFQTGPKPEAGDIEEAAHYVGAALGLKGVLPEIIDKGFATLTAPIAAAFPALPALTLGAMHVGPPHTHTHPPSLIPPAPPVPLPSLGVLLGPGAVNVFIGGLPAARCGDIGMAVTCGSLAPPFEIFTGSSSVFIAGSRAARVADLTRHCDPASGGSPSAMEMIMAGLGGFAALGGGSAAAVAQAAAEAAAMAVKALLGKDPGLPPLPGAMIGPPVPNVLIGGFPVPGIGSMLTGAAKKGLMKALGKTKAGKAVSTAADKAKARAKHGYDKAKSKLQRQANGKQCDGTEPVYLVTGENYDDFVDHAPGGLLQWRRHYSSARSTEDGPLGHGYRHFYQRTLTRRLHRASFTDWDGLSTELGRFELGADTTRADGYVLRRLGKGHFRLSHRGEPDLEFQGGEFDGQLPLTRVVSDTARLELGYDELGRLATLLEETKGTRQRSRRFELVYAADGHVSELRELDPLAPVRRDGVPVGEARCRYEYSAARDLVRVEDGERGCWSYEYDPFHRLTQKTDPRGYRYDFQYDASGRCIQASGQDGLWACEIQYFPEKGLTRYTEGEGATWEYHYDGDGVVTKIVDPYGGEKLRRLDDEGRVSVEVDSGGRELTWLYDDDGAHHARVDRFGHLYPPEVEQPVLDNPFARELPQSALGFLLGARVTPAPEAMLGLHPAALASVPAELQPHLRCFRTHAPGALRDGEVDPDAIAPQSPTLSLDRMGRKIREEDALGRIRSWQYDETGNLVAETDREGRRSTRRTTSWNLLGAQSDPLGNTVSYEYSSLEQLTAIVDPLGNQSRYDYDLKERLVRVQRHGRVREQYVYDAGDHFIEKRDGDGQVLFENTIHDNHLVQTRKLASGGLHQLDYDERGRVIEASTLEHRVQIGYGPDDQRSRDLRDGQGIEHHRPSSAEAASTVLGRYRQHEQQRATETVLTGPTGNSSLLEHREAGLVRRHCSNGSTELLQLDEEGRLEASLRYRRGYLGRQSGSAIRYTYSPEGDLLHVADSQRGITRYQVDAARRLTAEITPKGQARHYPLDPAGNLQSHPELGLLELSPGNLLRASRREAYHHDPRNHLARRERRAEGDQIHYHYDSFDMLVRIQREQTEPASLARLLSPAHESAPAAIPHPDATPHCNDWSAAYDALGRRLWTQWTTPGGQTLRREFYWDGDRLAAEILPEGKLRIYQYAGPTALVPLQFTDYKTAEAPPGSGQTYHVFSNPVGMPLCIEDEAGHIVWWAERVDPYGQLQLKPKQDIDYARPGTAIDYNPRWPGHYHDPETGLHYNRYRYYDPNLCRYLQSDPIGHAGSPVNLYAYCGNPLVQVDVLGLDHSGKPGKASGDDGGEVDGREGTLPTKGSKARKAMDRMVAQAKNARRAKGDERPNNFSLESQGRAPAAVSTAEANQMGKDFVGGGATEMSGDKGLVGKPFVASDGETYRRAYRSPAEKKNSPHSNTGKQANFETQRQDTTTENVYRKGKPPEEVTTTEWNTVSNGHVDVTD